MLHGKRVNTSLTNIILIYNSGKNVISYYTKNLWDIVFLPKRNGNRFLKEERICDEKKEVKIG